MNKHILSLLFCLAFICAPATHLSAQRSFTISGTVKNSETGEILIGATVLLKELKGVGASTNSYGFYSLTAPQGTYTLLFQYLGFGTTTRKLVLDKDQTIQVDLAPEAIKENEVVVSAERSNKNVVSTEMSTENLEMKEVQFIPVLLGEKDIMKTIQLLPGIKSAGEGNTGYYARGGNVDQNLILLDEAPVYNSAHLLGFLSIFNSDAIKDVKVMTGNIPAEYGGRLSSVLDIRTNDGNMKEYGGAAGIGMLDSRVLLDGPIEKDRGSFLVTGRRTYADLFLRLSSDTTINRTRLYFYDINVKTNYTLGDKDRVYLSGYFGRDNFSYPDVFGFDWGNTTATLRWNHIYGEKLFSNFSFIYSDYSYSNTLGAVPLQFVISSGIQDWNFKTDFQYFINSDNTLKFGVNSIYHTFIPGTISSAPGLATNRITVPKKYGLESAAYISHEFDAGPLLKINYGARFSLFNLLGPGLIYTYDSYGDVLDSASYSAGKNIKTYGSLEPRVSVNYLIDENSSIKSAYTRTAQYLHLLSNSTTTNPSDLWLPSSNNVKPQYADQISAGYYRNFLDNSYETHVEFYYKNMQNLIDYKNGADLQLNPEVESLLLYGRGWSYGAEVLIKKKYGKISGWLSYTWSKTMEQFADANHGAPFPARQDRTNDISLVGIYNMNTRWNFSAVWVYNTGNAVTFPAGNYIIDNHFVPYYTERNGYRMPAYHRLDLSATYNFNEKSSLNFSLYNAYNRANAWAIIFRQDPNNPLRTQAVQITLFPIIPSLTYNLIF